VQQRDAQNFFNVDHNTASDALVSEQHRRRTYTK
jgi:hypothetical protein